MLTGSPAAAVTCCCLHAVCVCLLFTLIPSNASATYHKQACILLMAPMLPTAECLLHQYLLLLADLLRCHWEPVVVCQ
jgi:hypothetical protein